jgi:hypothetical protein
MPKRIARILTLVAACALGGCTIQVNVPVNRFESPETVGKAGRVELDAAVGGSNDAVLTEDASTDAPSPAHPTGDHSAFFRFGAGVGLRDDLDLELRNFSELVVKYQILGQPRLTSRMGNVSLAVTLGAGGGYDSSNGTGLNQTQFQYDLTTVSLDAALIAGYRITDWWLLYAGPFFRYVPYTGHYAQGPENTSLPSGTPFSGTVSCYGGNLGFEFGNEIVQGRVECAFGQLESGSLNTGLVTCGGQLAFNFGAH